MKKLLFLILILTMATLSGCLIPRGLKSDVVVKHPDSSMLIIEFKGRYARVAIYDAAQNKMIEYPQLVPLDHYLHGWTLSKHDWQKSIRKKEND